MRCAPSKTEMYWDALGNRRGRDKGKKKIKTIYNNILTIIDTILVQSK